MDAPATGKGTSSDNTAFDHLDRVPPASRPPSILEDGDSSFKRSKRSFGGRVLTALGLRRNSAYQYLIAPTDKMSSEPQKEPLRKTRKCKRWRIAPCLKLVIINIPVVVLVFFGVLHILQAVIGRESLFWDTVAFDKYLPNWGEPGHAGEGLAHFPTDATRDVLPIPCHSHNDYWRRVPLFDAIHWGCTGVEADVWLFDDELYIGHQLASLTKNRTFKNLYVNPLVDLLDRMNPSTPFINATGHGVFSVDPQQTLVLLVDFKTNGRDLFPVVSKQLEPLREKGYLTFWDGKKVNSRAITVVGTGNTPFDMVVENTDYRDIFFDAPLTGLWEAPRSPIEFDDPLHGQDDELDYGEAMSLSVRNESWSGQGRIGTEIVSSPDDFNISTSYYASTSFRSAVGFVWRGHLSPRQMDIIRGQIRGAKKRGLKARYWHTPSWPISLRNHIWHVLVKEGADVLDVDDLRGAAVENWRMRMHDWFV